MVTTSGHFVVGRRARLELILPRAKLFQEGVDSLQQWLISVEQALAELRNAERVMLHLSDATDRAKVGSLPCVVELHVQYSKCALCYLYNLDVFFLFPVRRLLKRFKSKLLS